MPKIRNIIIFLSIAVILSVVYFFFFKKEKEPDLVSSTSSANATKVDVNKNIANSQIIANTLPVLLSIQNIKLDDSIFSDPAFVRLVDTSIILVPDGNEGRPNPFAPIGFDNIDNSTVEDESAINDTTINNKVPNKTN